MIALRPPEQVMRLERLGSSHQTRLSFMRVLLRKLRQGRWITDRPAWKISDQGVGHAVYRIKGEGQCYSLVAFAHDLPADQRSDRVIAESWDATFALVDGEATPEDIQRLAANVPLQEAGRVSDKELVLSRANRSVRLWDHVIDCLARGDQPDAAKIAQVGYLMRTTAVYGSGKFGAADFACLKNRPVLDGPFRAEMLTVWLIRTFVMDLVEHMARVKGGPNATTLSPGLRRQFGIGNSTGLGMAPFLANHPTLINAWITARETALARVHSLGHATDEDQANFQTALEKTTKMVSHWRSDHTYQTSKIKSLQSDLEQLLTHIKTGALQQGTPWKALQTWCENTLSIEGQELTATLMLEPYGALIDDLAETMTVNEAEGFRINGTADTNDLLQTIETNYAWTKSHDCDARNQNARFWYVSEAKLEPRLGERYDEPGAELEQPLDIARAVTNLAKDLKNKPDTSIADFLRQHPNHRHTIRRVQHCANAPYAEIQDNLIGADMMPIDMLRCKLAFFGATRFDPRSDRWLRICMFQGAPFPHELFDMPEDDWVLPA